MIKVNKSSDGKRIIIEQDFSFMLDKFILMDGIEYRNYQKGFWVDFIVNNYHNFTKHGKVILWKVDYVYISEGVN